MTVLQQTCYLTRKNIRHQLFPHLALCAALLAVTPLLFGLNDLDRASSATPLDMLVTLIGIILLTPIFLPEQSPGLTDTVRLRRFPLSAVFCLRAAYSLFFVFFLPGLMVLFMGAMRCEVSVPLWIGTASSAVLLGAMGAFSYALCRNIAAAYMVPVLFYVASYGLGNRLGVFYLFSNMTEFQSCKLIQLLSGLLLLAAAIILNSRKSTS